MDYKKKYLKYKLKYLTAKKTLRGGGDEGPEGIHIDIETYIEIYFAVFLFETNIENDTKIEEIDRQFEIFNNFWKYEPIELGNIFNFQKKYHSLITEIYKEKTKLKEKYNTLVLIIEKDRKECDGTNDANRLAKAIDRNLPCSIMG
tara:strand:- start:1130 stop:1567 length:438 start_codon:yes stop_codon:yes gene_type:complete